MHELLQCLDLRVKSQSVIILIITFEALNVIKWKSEVQQWSKIVSNRCFYSLEAQMCA